MLLSSSSLPPPCSSSEINPSQGQKPTGAQVPALTRAVFNSLFMDSISGNRAPSMHEEGGYQELSSCVRELTIQTARDQMAPKHSVGGTLPSGSHFEERVPWRGPHPRTPPKPHSHTGGQEAALMPKPVVLLRAYRKPPARICPTRSQSVFLQSINPLNLMFLELKCAILKQLKRDANTNKNTIHQLCCCKAAGFEVG